jgi:hypothetical protein
VRYEQNVFVEMRSDESGYESRGERIFEGNDESRNAIRSA